ncbi:hypothetical protein PGT21_033228 [Puccinia graminis f. sp. tritici]|uniref:Uncharacterized protein n=1 Tax=Puccinia graminis f. sp. tritici TaxID=56615 RepID=A0A5B0NFG7_PUCGR|nr:hypothetical protein PGT21_033228 [Puccinia graminis f. sp. tritici]
MLLVLTSTVALSVAISTAFPVLIPVPVPITCYRPGNADTPRFVEKPAAAT